MNERQAGDQRHRRRQPYLADQDHFADAAHNSSI
jgi:hypothetical protein